MTTRESANTNEVPVGYRSDCTDGENTLDGRLEGAELDRMAASAAQAAEFLKSQNLG